MKLNIRYEALIFNIDKSFHLIFLSSIENPSKTIFHKHYVCSIPLRFSFCFSIKQERNLVIKLMSENIQKIIPKALIEKVVFILVLFSIIYSFFSVNNNGRIAEEAEQFAQYFALDG